VKGASEGLVSLFPHASSNPGTLYPFFDMKKIEMGHGSGGRMSSELIREVFLKYISSEELRLLEDAASLKLSTAEAAMTTDSYVIRPLFFPGGNIGKLSVCGTINDLVVSGAVPKYLSLAFVIEEGFSMEELEEILKSTGEEAKRAGVSIVTGDTKVVGKGDCDGIYINTTGIGETLKSMSAGNISIGDAVIVTGTVGDHGTAIALARNEFEIDTPVQSDCASLNDMVNPLFAVEGVKWMRDPTRGGLATVLAELAGTTGLGLQIFEDKVPVREDVRFISDMLGYDPLYLANEGKAVIVTSEDASEQVLGILRNHPLGDNASVIGHVTNKFRGARLTTSIGGERNLDMLEEELLPRIC